MKFETLYNLILENNYKFEKLIPEEDIKNYNMISFFDDKKEANLCYKFLHTSGYDKEGAFVAHMLEKNKRPLPIIKKNISDDEFYFLFIPKTFNEKERKKLKLLFRDFLKQHNFFHWSMYNTIAFAGAKGLEGCGGIFKYDPMNEYSLDQKTKEDWVDIVTNL